jgi:hypothetical protein
LSLVILAEQLAALLAKTIVDIKGVADGSHSQTTAEILDDADAKWNEIIAASKAALPAS